MQLIDHTISLSEIVEIAKARSVDFVKAVVDIERKIMVIDGQMHVDEETELLEHGSAQENLWGINIYPSLSIENRIEFDSITSRITAIRYRSRGHAKPPLKEAL
mgnify:CR=1 FL=1